MILDFSYLAFWYKFYTTSTYGFHMKYLLLLIFPGPGNTRVYVVSTELKPQLLADGPLVMQTKVSPFLCLINSDFNIMYINFEPPLQFVHTSPLSLSDQLLLSMSCQLAIQWGKKQDTQSFSAACPIDTAALPNCSLRKH